MIGFSALHWIQLRYLVLCLDTQIQMRYIYFSSDSKPRLPQWEAVVYVFFVSNT